ncbi:MAG: hypothetical protein DRO88_10870 [Promethearchaeia archaeon]|nr:MAG: hypothetical protein DRO88_10870 [Candidatus Lokiarchaeia archaeon]
MNFSENELIGAALIGFDMIEGPYIKWHRRFYEKGPEIDMENFLMNFYLSFRGGDEELQPLAILYPEFYIVAFPHGLELCCLFLYPGDLSNQMWRLNQIATELIVQMESMENDDELPTQSSVADNASDMDYDEIKRIVVNLLHDQEISTPELRRYFKMTNSEIWRIMSQLEESRAVVRTEKRGRTQFWTAVQ